LSPTLFGGSVEEGIVRLFVRRSECCEEVEEVALDLSRSGCRSVCFVQNDEWSKYESQCGKKKEKVRINLPQPPTECLSKHKPSLGHRPLRSIHNQRHAIHHTHDPFNLTSKIRMSRRIDDIDQVPVIKYAGAFGQDRYTTLAFEVVGVHEASDKPTSIGLSDVIVLIDDDDGVEEEVRVKSSCSVALSCLTVTV
jgi:hypothetical protein